MATHLGCEDLALDIVRLGLLEEPVVGVELELTAKVVHFVLERRGAHDLDYSLANQHPAHLRMNRATSVTWMRAASSCTRVK